MRNRIIAGTVLLVLTYASQVTSDAECPALATLNPCTRQYGTCLAGGHWGGMACECMIAPNDTGKTCQGRIDAFNVVDVLPDFPSQIAPCDHEAKTGICYWYHNCNAIGSGTETGPCGSTTDCTPGLGRVCNVGIAFYIDKDCEPYACTIE